MIGELQGSFVEALYVSHFVLHGSKLEVSVVSTAREMQSEAGGYRASEGEFSGRGESYFRTPETRSSFVLKTK